MRYYITCTCGEEISVDAEHNEAAVAALIPAMDKHVAAKAHLDVPENLSQEQKEGMVRSTMKRA